MEQMNFEWEGTEARRGLLGIGIANFQGVGKYQIVPIAPLTLLYGQNSAGKSTIADALELFESLTLGTRDAKSLLKRWARLPAATDASPEMHPPLVISIFCAPFWSVRYYFNWTKKNFSSRTNDYFEQANYDWLKCFFREAGPQDRPCIPFVYSLAISRGKFESITITFESALFAEIRFTGEEEFDYPVAVISFSSAHPLYKKLLERFPVDFEGALKTISYGGELARSRQNISIRISYSEYRFDKGLATTPYVWADLETDYTNGDAERIATDDAASLLAKSFVTFLTSGLAEMAGLSCIYGDVPPIRRIPSALEAQFEVKADKYHSSHVTHEDSRSDDMIWWRHLATSAANNGNLFPRISEALSSENALDTGYRLGFQLHHIIDDAMLRAGRGKRRATVKELIESSNKRVRLFLLDHEGNELRFDDVGAGVSQILPVVIAIYSVSGEYILDKVYLHQPELHLHPRIQAQLGDVLLDCINTPEEYPRVLFVESHSEHLLLRLLKRVRLTSFGAAVSPSHRLTPDRLSVIYVDRDKKSGTTFKHLRVSQSGDFLDRWPKGFFTEREIDLFDDHE